MKTVTGEWAEDAPAVLDELIEAHFPAPWAAGCDWAMAKKLSLLKD